MIYGRTDYGSRKWLEELLKSLALCDHMGDVADVASSIAQQNGITLEWDDQGGWVIVGG